MNCNRSHVAGLDIDNERNLVYYERHRYPRLYYDGVQPVDTDMETDVSLQLI